MESLVFPPKAVKSLRHDTSTETITVTTQVYVDTYVDGAVVSSTYTPTVDVTTNTADEITVDEVLAAGNFVGPTISTNTFSPYIYTYDPPNAVPGVGNYVRTSTRTQTQTSRTQRWRRRLAVEFDVSHITSFGEMTRFNNPTRPVIHNFDFVFNALRILPTGVGSAILYSVRGVAIDTPLPTNIEQFDALFGSQTQTASHSTPGQKFVGGTAWTPTQTASTITIYLDQHVSLTTPGAATLDNFLLSISEYRNRASSLIVPHENTFTRTTQTDPSYRRTWRLVRALPSNDIQFAYRIKLDAPNYTNPVATPPWHYEFRLDDAEAEPGDPPALLIRFDFVPNTIPPEWVRSVNQGEIIGPGGRLRIEGLGLSLDVNFSWGAFRGPGDVIICLYDDTLQIIPVDSGNNNTIVGNAVVPPGGGFAYFATWSSETDWLTRGPWLTLPRDPLIAPRVYASIATETPGVWLASFQWKQTESLQTIGQERIPYDPELDETKNPKGCPEANKNCLLIGTEEDLRLVAEIEWGELSGPLPLGARQCQATNFKEISTKVPSPSGSFSTYPYQVGNTIWQVWSLTYTMIHSGSVSHQFYRQWPNTFATRQAVSIIEPRRFVSGSVTVNDFDPNDRLSAFISVFTEMRRAFDGSLELRVQAGMSYFVLLGFGELMGGASTRITGAAAAAGFASDPCGDLPEWVEARTQDIPAPQLLTRPIYCYQAQVQLEWVVPLGTDDLAKVDDLDEVVLTGDTALGYSPSMPHYAELTGLSGEFTDVEEVNIEHPLNCANPTANFGTVVRSVTSTVRVTARPVFEGAFHHPGDLVLRIRPQGTPYATPP